MSASSILIVGSNRGIGLGLTEEALKRDSTTKVYATARDPAKADGLTKLATAYPNRLVVLRLDMLSEASVEAAATELKKHTSTLETVIINAGILLGEGKIQDLAANDLLQNLNANVVGPHNLTKAFSPFLLTSKAEKKTLTYISSGVGSVAAEPMVTAMVKNMYKTDYIPNSGYAVTKTAVNMLGRQWADSLEPKGIAVLLVHPGAVSTDMNQGDGLITVQESATGVWAVVDKSTIEAGAKGILSYDGQTFPW
ncbi:hypothetical protein RQP46_002617 [Phenoliferia psychrophenolica]